MTEDQKRFDSSKLSDVVEAVVEVAGNVIEVSGEAIGGAAGATLEVVGEVLSSIG